jgi:hypothetical protein
MRTGRGAVNEENGSDKANTEGEVETYQLSQTLLGKVTRKPIPAPTATSFACAQTCLRQAIHAVRMAIALPDRLPVCT